MSKPNKFAALAQQGLDETKHEQKFEGHQANPVPASTAGEPVRMLGGRVPDSIFREFQYAKLEAEDVTKVRRVTTEEAVEAMVRLLRDPEVKAKWMDEVAEIRQRRGR